MVYLVRVATCNLNQWSLDFDGNLARIRRSLSLSLSLGARYRTGPELELSGYGCEDHFLEPDTEAHSWSSLALLLSSSLYDDLLFDVGMAVSHHGARYNCRIVCLNRRVLFVRPKLCLADDGNYREGRYFAAWQQPTNQLDLLELPTEIFAVTGQKNCPIGVAILRLRDSCLAYESCEELFTPLAPHIAASLAGAEIISNSSGSHHALRKISVRINLLAAASTRSSCSYLYANQKGCDGGRLFYDGCACVFHNGECVAQGEQFSLSEVDVIAATVDLDQLRTARGAVPSRASQAAHHRQRIPELFVDFFLGDQSQNARFSLLSPSPIIKPRQLSGEEEISLGPACWLWDYLRRSKQSGYFLPLSGGADSAATAAIVGSMCHLVVEAVTVQRDEQVIRDLERLFSVPSFSSSLPSPSFSSSSPSSMSVRADGLPTHFPSPFTPQSVAYQLFHTCYLSTDNSGPATRARAASLARQIGAYHLNVNVQSIVDACVKTLSFSLSLLLRYKMLGGEERENLALQNLQARTRMVLSYALASLLPLSRGLPGSLLVLASGNVDEALRGYLTKYDCSSADLNPIGTIAKSDLKKFLLFAAEKFHYSALLDIVSAVPTAELEPSSENYSQTDEEDMKMSYEELGIYGRLRKLERCGPVSMFVKLAREWTTTRALHLPEVAQKVKTFFFYYAINRHKSTVLTPAYHAENYSPDDNRFDHRPFLYNAKWERQFAEIDRMVTENGKIAPESEKQRDIKEEKEREKEMSRIEE